MCQEWTTQSSGAALSGCASSMPDNFSIRLRPLRSSAGLNVATGGGEKLSGVRCDLPGSCRDYRSNYGNKYMR